MKTFNTVADLQAAHFGSTGQIVETKGYYVAGDGGGSRYLVAPNQSVDGYVNHLCASGHSLLQVESDINTRRDYFERPITESTAGPIYTTDDDTEISNIEVKAWVNPVISVVGQSPKIEDVKFSGFSHANRPNQCVYLRENSIAPLIASNSFNLAGYQIIQASGEYTYGARVVNNTSIDSSNDFLLQNNDFQNGITHSWLVSGNYVDQTNSALPYGQTESRGIGFTSCYGGMVLGNALVGCKGDAAAHLENIQETAYIGNYYRNNLVDVLFSGLNDRRLVRLNVTTGSVAVGQTITDSVTGATGSVLFWLDDGDIAQVINITGGSFGEGNAFTTSGGASGTVVYDDTVQSHSNHIGNIYHKTNDDTVVSFSSAGGPYTLRNYYLGNTWNNQGTRAGKTAVSFPSRNEVTNAFGSYRGWESALNGGGATASANDFLFNKYWGNEYNLNANIVTGCKWFGDKFYDGLFQASDVQNSIIEGCTFSGGEINISSSTNDNSWINNKVSTDVTITSLSTADFERWESIPYRKHGNTHTITANTSITSAIATTELIANLTASGGSNRSAVIEWKMVSRSSSSGGRRRADMGRAFIDWNNVGTPTITLDPSNYSVGSPVIDLLIAINGNDVELSYDFQYLNSSSQASIEMSIVAEAVTVEPVKYLDEV